MSLASGDIFEKRYEIREELGASEFSVVYRATSTDNGRDVVVRVLRAPPSGYPDGFDSKFMSEAKRVSKLRHAGTVRLESYGATEEGTLYLVTEFVSGSTLADVIEEEEVPARDVIALVKRMAESLGEAHGRGIIHRELKPQNIAIPLRRGVLGAKIRGFGITKYVENDGPLSAATVGFGSPRYMSPEQILGEELDFSANLYSLGLLAYELLARRPAIEATSPREILAIHLSTTPFELPTEVPPQLQRLLGRMIAKSQEERFQSADELLDAVSELDYSKLSLSAQMKVAKMVAKLEAAEDEGKAPTETSVDPTLRFLDPEAEQTEERLPDTSEDITELSGEDMTPTNVVVDDGDITQLAEESSAPLAVGDAPEDEPTDEIEDKTKPQKKLSRATREEERPSRTRKRSSSRRRSSKRRRSAKGRSRRRSKRRSKRERDDRRSKKRRSDRDRDRKRRKKSRTPDAKDEDHVSPWVAFGAIIGAIVVALIVMGGFLYLRSLANDRPSIPTAVVSTPSKPIGATTGSPPSPTGLRPADLGSSEPAMMDLAAVPTGCGQAQPTKGWTAQSKLVGLTEFGYDAYVPESYTGEPAPMILVAHPPGPPGMYGKKWANHVRLTRIAESLGAVMLVPEDRSMRPWMPDIEGAHTEFDRVMNHAVATYCVDLTQVIGIGMSSGAQALDQFACENPGRFNSLGLVAHWGSPEYECKGRRPSTIVVNGLMDRVSPIQGGGGCFGRFARLPLKETEAMLQTQHGCSKPALWSDETDGSCGGFESCTTSDLVLCHVPSGVHGWPGSQLSVVRCMEEFAEVPNLTSFPTTSVLERFFRQQLEL